MDTFFPVKTSILVVDDEITNLSLVAGLLREHYQVKVAKDAERALVLAQREQPDLILLDVMMPGELDGYQVCAKVKGDPMLAGQTKVILLTARAQKEDEEQGRKAGADAYLTNAFSPLKLRDLVDNMLGMPS